MLALCLCVLVAMGSMALIETDRRISGSIGSLPAERPLPGMAAAGRNARRSSLPTTVVLVTVDGLRPDRLELYGYERQTAPNLAAFAEEALVFEVAGAQASSTLVSHKSLLTGKYPSKLLLEVTSADLVELANLEAPHDFLIDTFVEVEGTLATRLNAAGYRTAAFTDAGLSAKDGFAVGFQEFSEHASGLGESVRRARRWLSEVRDAPAFLFLHGSEETCDERSHAAYETLFCADHGTHGDPADRSTAASDHYDGGVACADEQLGLLFDELRALELYDDALVVVTSGHGFALGERGNVGHGDLYPEELLVPLLVHLPSSWNIATGRSPEPVELVDVLPTLLASTRAKQPTDLDGRSLLPIIQRGVKGRTFLVAQTTLREDRPGEVNPASRAILDPGRWHARHDARHGTLELFALDRDPLAPVDLDDLAGRDVPAFLESFFHAPAEPANAGARRRGTAITSSRPRLAPRRD